MVTVKKAEFTHEVVVNNTRIPGLHREYRRLHNGIWEVRSAFGWEQASDIVSVLLDHVIEGK